MQLHELQEHSLHGVFLTESGGFNFPSQCGYYGQRKKVPYSHEMIETAHNARNTVLNIDHEMVRGLTVYHWRRIGYKAYIPIKC